TSEHTEVLGERLAAADRVVEGRHDQDERRHREDREHVGEADERAPVDRRVHRLSYCASSMSRSAARCEPEATARRTAALAIVRPPPSKIERSVRSASSSRGDRSSLAISSSTTPMFCSTSAAPFRTKASSLLSAGSTAGATCWPSSCSDSFAAV